MKRSAKKRVDLEDELHDLESAVDAALLLVEPGLHDHWGSE